MAESLRPRVLITGGAGFIGTELTRRLDADLSYDLIVFDKKREPSKNFPGGVIFINGDLKDKKKFADIISDVNPTVILHLASNIGPRGYLEEHADEIVGDNKAMDESLYAGIEGSNVRLVVPFSSAMVFENAHVYPYQESDLPNTPQPTNLYGQTKLNGERLCMLSGRDYIVLRPHNVYGKDEQPKGKGRGDRHVIPATIEQVRTGTLPLVILGNPEDTRPFTYIDDAVEATVRLLFSGLRGNQSVLNQDFNIGPTEATKIYDLYKTAWELTGSQRPFSYTTQEIPGSTSHRREMDPTKIYSATGWQPVVALREGLALVDPSFVNMHA